MKNTFLPVPLEQVALPASYSLRTIVSRSVKLLSMSGQVITVNTSAVGYVPFRSVARLQTASLPSS